jgi:uncharacterized protein YqiB (DUF1249 family)
VLASVRSATLIGVEGQPVTVEVHVSKGLPAYSVVGLPETAVREARERVRAALLSSETSWPLKRITVNLCNRHTRQRQKANAETQRRTARPQSEPLDVRAPLGENASSAADWEGQTG